jgi:polyphenol oxidase
MSSFVQEREATRRWFIQEFGAGVVGLWGLYHLAAPPPLYAQGCAPPGPPGAPAAWRADCRAIRPRKSAASLSTAEVARLKEAYKAMRDLAVSAPADPRGFTHQANIHCWNCAGGGGNVHGSWRFFAWHRAYLYFHERILGNLIGDPEFRLPYWDWDNSLHRKLPPAYVTPNDATNPLWNGTRSLPPATELPVEDVGPIVMNDVMNLDTFPEFGGTAAFGGSPEGLPHGAVHVDVGGDMGFLSTAARDPVFYAHHSNVDKMWSDWNKVAPAHTNPTDATFLSLTFSFYNESKVWTSIKASQLLDHENRLRYIYEPWRLFGSLFCWIRIPVDIGWLQRKAIRFDSTLKQSLAVPAREGKPIRLHIEGMVLPRDKSAVYRLYASEQEARDDRGPESAGYLGLVPVVLNDPRNEHPLMGLRNLIVDVTARIPRLVEREGLGQLYLVERGASPAARRVVKAEARNVFFTRGEPQR